MADRETLKAEAKAKALAMKEVARQKAVDLKDGVERMKALKKTPNPVYVQMPEPTGNAEADALADLSELQSGFRKRAQDESARFALAVDTEYWACVCFQTREQKEYFFAALNLLQLGDKYIDGLAAAKQLGITLPKADVPYNVSVKVDPKWSKFSK